MTNYKLFPLPACLGPIFFQSGLQQLDLLLNSQTLCIFCHQFHFHLLRLTGHDSFQSRHPGIHTTNFRVHLQIPYCSATSLLPDLIDLTSKGIQLILAHPHFDYYVHETFLKLLSSQSHLPVNLLIHFTAQNRQLLPNNFLFVREIPQLLPQPITH